MEHTFTESSAKEQVARGLKVLSIKCARDHCGTKGIQGEQRLPNTLRKLLDK